MNFVNNSKKTKEEKQKLLSHINVLSLGKEDINKEFEKNLINKNIKKIKIRNSGIDFIRILDMYIIIIHHINIHGDLFKKYYKFKSLKLFCKFSSWHISGFILISGMVGYKTCRYSNLIYLWFCVLFYSIGIQIFIILFKPEFIIEDNLIYSFCPIIFCKYWYFSKYFGLYLLLPVINKGIEFLNQYELKIVFVNILIIYIIWNNILNPTIDIFNINNWNSIAYFLMMYIIGAYLGKYLINKKYNGKKKYIFYLINIFIYVFSCFLCYYWRKIIIKEQNGFKKILSIILSWLFIIKKSSFPIILQSISISLFITQIKFNKYISKIITFFGPFIFGVYLIHDNKIIRYNIIKNLFNKISKDISYNKIIILICLKSLKIFILSTIIEIIRHYFFIICRIKKFCIYLEKIFIKLFKQTQ